MLPSVLFRCERCIGCGACAEGCPAGALALVDGVPVKDVASCEGCGVCAEVCPASAMELCGHRISISELMEELRRDEIFFRDGGGVTFSGGEPLMQPEFLMEALKSCGGEGWHRALDTSGFVKTETLLEAAKLTDLFLYDIKHMDTEKHRLYTGAGNEVVLENLKRLSESGVKINVRFPFMPGLNSCDENIRALAEFVAGLKGVTAVSILPYHTVAMGKHDRWSMEYKLRDLLPPTEHQLRRAAAIIESFGLFARIGS